MTIKEVAKLAGVSSAAVSRYLNGGPLSQKKKEQIAKAIEETGYRPNLMAKTMRTGKVRQIGIIVPRIFSESVNQVMDGLAEEFLEKDYLTLLGYSDKRKDRELQYLEMMQSNRVAGIVLMGTTLSEIKRMSLENCTVPLVVTGQKYSGLHCVYHDDRGGVRELTQRMIAKGRSRIAYIGVREDDLAAGLARREGFLEALESAGLPVNNVPRRTADFDAQSGFLCMQELLEECPDLDGVICATDIIAHGAISALKRAGRRIPEDVSIAGVGDNWADLISSPTLTTVHLHHRRCGMLAARMLLNLIGEDDEGGSRGGPEASGPNHTDQSISDPGLSEQSVSDDHHHIQLGYQIIERESLLRRRVKTVIIGERSIIYRRSNKGEKWETNLYFWTLTEHLRRPDPMNRRRARSKPFRLHKPKDTRSFCVRAGIRECSPRF